MQSAHSFFAKFKTSFRYKITIMTRINIFKNAISVYMQGMLQNSCRVKFIDCRSDKGLGETRVFWSYVCNAPY